MKHLVKLWLGLFMGMMSAHASADTSNGKLDYIPEKIIFAMKQVDPQLKIVIAHRGMYRGGCPENTECAIDQAVMSSIEAVEIDVKETRDGTPWPSHDINIGRSTTFTRNGVFFNPYHHSAANDANNPLISTMHDGDMRKLQLRDHLGNVTHWKSVSLEDLLVVSRAKHKNVVFVFDIKYPQSVLKIAQMVKRHHLEKQVVLKFSATFFPALQITKHTLGLAFAPTLYAPQLDEIASKYYLNQKFHNERVYQYMRDFAEVAGLTFYEIGNKMYREVGSSVAVEGPLANLTHRLNNEHFAVANFVPVIEHHADSRSPITGFYHTDGYCCTQLKDFLTRTAHFGSELRDDRPNLEMLIRHNEIVITDDALLAKNEALRLGSRQHAWKMVGSK